jgi:imidazolonepropionase-like amidohydrolase
VKVPAGAEIVDLAGKALLPGLIDMHAHLGDGDGVLDLASGVTTVRDVGNDAAKLADFQARFDGGEAIGPHVFRYGFIEGRGDKAASAEVTATNEEEALAGVKLFVDRGYDGIKIYNSIDPALVPVITKAAHDAGKQVTGHIPAHMLAQEAVEAGYDGIEHINMLFLNFLATHDTDTRDITRFTLVGEQGAALDLKSKPVKAFIKLLHDHHTVIDPTLNAFEDILAGVPGEIIPGLESTVARLPVLVQRGFLQNGLPGADPVAYRASFEACLKMVLALYKAKVTLVLGTDSMAGLMLHHEIALFVRAGIPPAEVLKMATIGAARALGHAKELGTITAGKAADLVVIDGDPVKRIADLDRVVSTMRGGVVYPSAPLFEAMGVQPAM